MLEIKFDNPTRGEINEALKKLRLIEPISNHRGRLNRQGKDISILWKRVDEITKEDNKLILVVRELIKHSGLEIEVRKGGQVGLKKRGRKIE